MPVQPKSNSTRYQKAKTSSKNVELAERRQQAFTLRRDGESIDEIAKHLNVSPRTAFIYIQERLNEISIHTQETLGQIKAMSDARLLKIIMGLMPQAKAGNVSAARAVVAVEERRAKLLGLDAPVRMEVEATLNAGRRDIDAELAEVIDISVARKAPELVSGTEVPPGVATEGPSGTVTPKGGLESMGPVNGSGMGQNHNGSGRNGV